MKNVLISGASGFLGSSLCRFLSQNGFNVRALSRHKHQCTQNVYHWDPYRHHFDKDSLHECDVVIHLSGENVLSPRWTDKKKKRIRDSRLATTQFLIACIKQYAPQLSLFISGSAIGYYGSATDTVMTEDSPSGTGFLATLGREWENLVLNDPVLNMRRVTLRTGVVLNSKGGMLKHLNIFLKLGLYFKLGMGNTYMSWIALEDWLKAVLHVINTPSLKGPVNLVSPEPSTNLQWVNQWKNLHGGMVVRIPESIIKIVHGEFAHEILLCSQRVKPEKLMKENHEFIFKTLASYIIHHLKKNGSITC